MQIGAQEAIDPLIAALNDEDSTVRDVTAQALGEIGDSRAVLPLQGALEDDAPRVRGSAAVALGKLRAFEALDALCRHLGEDDDVWARAGAAEALGMLGGKVAFQALRRALNDPDYMVRQKVEHAIAEILRRGEEDKTDEPA